MFVEEENDKRTIISLREIGDGKICRRITSCN